MIQANRCAAARNIIFTQLGKSEYVERFLVERRATRSDGMMKVLALGVMLMLAALALMVC
jgi:hypothetical protein